MEHGISAFLQATKEDDTGLHMGSVMFQKLTRLSEECLLFRTRREEILHSFKLHWRNGLCTDIFLNIISREENKYRMFGLALINEQCPILNCTVD